MSSGFLEIYKHLFNWQVDHSFLILLTISTKIIASNLARLGASFLVLSLDYLKLDKALCHFFNYFFFCRSRVPQPCRIFELGD